MRSSDSLVFAAAESGCAQQIHLHLWLLVRVYKFICSFSGSCSARVNCTRSQRLRHAGSLGEWKVAVLRRLHDCYEETIKIAMQVLEKFERPVAILTSLDQDHPDHANDPFAGTISALECLEMYRIVAAKPTTTRTTK